jgi:hypothetical protein
MTKYFEVSRVKSRKEGEFFEQREAVDRGERGEAGIFSRTRYFEGHGARQQGLGGGFGQKRGLRMTLRRRLWQRSGWHILRKVREPIQRRIEHRPLLGSPAARHSGLRRVTCPEARYGAHLRIQIVAKIRVSTAFAKVADDAGQPRGNFFSPLRQKPQMRRHVGRR